MSYSVPWGEMMSKTIRGKLGVDTLQEAILLTDDHVTRADFESLRSAMQATNDALASLAEAVTPKQKEDATTTVQARELDEKEMAKRLGISLDDVRKIRDENEYQSFKKNQERLEAERAAAAADDEDEDDDGKNGKGTGSKLLDGLGGIRNVRP